MCSWDKNERQILLEEQVLAEPGFCPMFSEVVSQPFQDAPPDSAVLKVLWAPFRANIVASQSTAVLINFICSFFSSQTCL